VGGCERGTAAPRIEGARRATKEDAGAKDRGTRVDLRLFVALLVTGCARPGHDPPTQSPVHVNLAGGTPGIGFDDLRYSPRLHRVLVPAGRSGRLALIDPDTLRTTSLALFSSKPDYSGGHDDGPTSVDEAGGRLAVTDRTTHTLVVFDATAPEHALTVPLGSEPDYVRFVPTTHEIWVTEPDAERIEVLSDAANAANAAPVPSATIAVADGPESLVVDAVRGRAYTHRWHGATLAIDVKTRAVVGQWSNGCEGSRGIAVDEQRGWLFASCSEGVVSVLDAEHDGALLSRIDAGAGFDVMGYSERLGHLYLSGSACRCTVVLGVDSHGQLSLLERAPGPPAAHCAVGDDRGHIWVCAPETGSVIRSTDRHPASLQ